VADAVLDELGWTASCGSPASTDYTFADSEPDEQCHVADCSNRAPYPTLHLLREASIERAVESFPDAADIYQRNIDTLRQLGWDDWRALWKA
jgi:hypothetical protein